MAGYRVVYANEFVELARKVYAENHPKCCLDPRDIREVKPSDILKASGVSVGDLDLFDGSPPCSAFSLAGSRDKGWGQVKKYSDTSQRTDDLFFEYIRLLDGIKPKVFVAENVAGLVSGAAKGYFKKILSSLRQVGYRVSCRVLDAQWLGVPQMRERTIFVGVREDLGIDPVHPSPLPYRYTIKEVIEGLSEKGLSLPITKGTMTYKLWSASRAGDSLSVAYEKMKGKKAFYTHVKQSPDKPSNTITATMCNLHWEEPRKLSVNELKRICSFPDDFVLFGSVQRQYERLGRSVPPLMMMRIASEIKDKVLSCVE